MKKATYMLTIIAFLAITTGCQNNNKKEQTSSKSETITSFEFEKEITITGTLQNLDYENLAGEKLSTFILELENGINVDSKNPEFKSQKNIKEIQVGFSDDVKDASKYLKKSITIKGFIYPEQTVHDRRPVVMINATITK